MVCNDRAAIPQRAEHFGGIEAEDTGDPERPGHPSAEP